MSRTALVTGANRGIGAEAALQLAAAGLDVVATSRGGTGHERMDVSDPASVEECAASLRADGIEIDVLVNNAGVLLDDGEGALAITDQLLRATLEVNLFGPLRTIRAFVPAMVERGYGRVVNVSSGAGQVTETSSYAPAYSVSKAALNLLTRKVALAVRGDVKVNAMCPGWVRTDMGGPAAPRSVSDAVETLVWLATLPADGPTNGFFRDRRPISW